MASSIAPYHLRRERKKTNKRTRCPVPVDRGAQCEVRGVQSAAHRCSGISSEKVGHMPREGRLWYALHAAWYVADGGQGQCS